MSIQLQETWLNVAAHPVLWAMVVLAQKRGGLWSVPGLGVLVSDAEIARQILQNDSAFSKNGPGSFADQVTATLGTLALSNMDGADHHQLRTALAGVASPASAEALVGQHATQIASLKSRLSAGEQVDLVRFINQLSGRIAFDLVGAAPPVRSEAEASLRIVALGTKMSSVLGLRRVSVRQIHQARADADQILEYFSDAFAHQAPPGSLLERLQNLVFTLEQARGIILIYVLAATLTVSAALPRISALLIDNDLLESLAGDCEGQARALEEGLRFTAPLPGTMRIARHDLKLAGRSFSAGTRMIILTRNLARDAKLFPNPHRFDITRVHDPRSKRLWYGAGPHYCAGVNLAQLQLKAVLAALADSGSPLCIVKRRPTFGALLPAYSQLLVAAKRAH